MLNQFGPRVELLVPTIQMVQGAINPYGILGPRCEPCSGWGKTLKIKPGDSGLALSTCVSCKGAGVDTQVVLQQTISDLVGRLSRAEAHGLLQAKKLSRLERLIKKGPPRGKNSRQTWVECLAWTVSDATAIANTTTEAISFPNITIPSNYMQDGRILRLTQYGKLSTTGTPTMTWALRYNGVAGTLLATTEAVTMGSGVTNVNWRVDYDIITRANGASGSLLAMGTMQVHSAAGTVLTNVFGVSGFDAPAAVSVDLSTDWPLSVTQDWSAASASNTSTGMMYNVESLN